MSHSLCFVYALSCITVVAGGKPSCVPVPSELASELQTYAMTHDHEEGGAFNVSGVSFAGYKILPGSKSGYVFSAPPWPAAAFFHVHPVTSYFLPSAADFEAVLRNTVAYKLNEDYDFCPEGKKCIYKEQEVCDSFLGTNREAVFAPNGVYVYGPSKSLIQEVAGSEDPESIVQGITAQIGPFDCDDCWPKCGHRQCHMHPWAHGKGNYNSKIVGDIQPFANCVDGKPENCVVPASSQTVDSHAQYIKFLRDIGFELDFYPYSSQVCLHVRGSLDSRLDPFKPMCKPSTLIV